MDSNALKNEFLVESFENLSTINEDITKFERESDNKEILNKIYRTVHTMKGSASFLGYKKLQDLTHSAENLLDAIREDLISLHSHIVDSLLSSFDACFSILKSIEVYDNEGDTDIEFIKERLDRLLEVNLNDEIETQQIAEVEAPRKIQEEEIVAPELSNAAMESLRELVDSGKVGANAFDELTIKNVENKKDESSTQNHINLAALDSLRELADTGAIDSSVFDELNTVENKKVAIEFDNSEEEDFSQTELETEIEEAFKEEVESIEISLPKVELEKKPVTDFIPVKKEFKYEAISELSESSKSIADSVVRVNVNVIDNIMNLVGELVLNRNQILQYSNSHLEMHELSRLSQQLNNITSELQEEVMSTRMQPIGSILSKFERLVRDYSKANNKQINLKLTGQETELDKTLIEAIKDPLVHIVRNAIDHGIESVEERSLNEKPQIATISIRAYNESGQVTIEVSDDGRGLSKEKIKAKAIEKFLITEEDSQSMSDQQFYALIFNPGFSTAEKVTDISGRGVGMDVVKTNIEKIGGNITLTSEQGKGATFKMRIPLTLAIVPALIVRDSSQSFAIPQINLVELVRLEGKEELNLIENVSGSEFLRLRGNLTPLFRLNQSLKLDLVEQKFKKISSTIDDITSKFLKKEKSITKSKQLNTDALNVIILNAENNYFGIIVDEILDTEEIVVKPISTIKGLSIFGGATIMGDGSVALILDAFGFLNKFTILKDLQSVKVHKYDKQLDTIEQNGEMQENILFSLCDKRLYAVALSLVSRLEEFSVKDIEKVGDKQIIRYLNTPMQLINLEKVLGLNVASSLDKLKNSEVERITCIVTNIRGKNYGLVVNEIIDISIDKVEIDDTAVDREGILGTIFIHGKTVSLVDLYAILNEQRAALMPEITNNLIIENGTKKILLVDDSAMYRKMEKDALNSMGYYVETAINGEDGLNLLEKDQYDLLITDIEMPVLDGYEFIKRVRAIEKFKMLPVVALSTRTSEIDRKKGKEAGFDHHLEKFRKDEVLRLVEEILKRN